MSYHAVITSDWHGDAITDGVSRRAEVYRAAMRAATTAIELDLRHPGRVVFVFGGDLTDPHTPRSIAAIADALRIVRALQIVRIPQIWMPGNHDVFEDGSGDHTLMPIAAAGEGVTVPTTGKAVDVVPLRGPAQGVTIGRILALPFAPTSHAYDPAALVHAVADEGITPDLAVGHLTLDGVTPGSESVEYARGRDVFWPLDALRERMPNTKLIGAHYHVRQVYDGVQIIGSLARLTHGEAEAEPGFLVVEVK